MLARVVENEVVRLAAPREVVARVVDHVIGADRSDQVDVPWAAHAAHFGAESLGDLDGERADAPGCPIDQDLLTCLDVAVITNRLERNQAGHGD
jgi:hypothetical protein